MARSRRATGVVADDRRRAAARPRPRSAPSAGPAGTRGSSTSAAGSASTRPSSARKRCSERTATSARATDAGGPARRLAGARRRPSTSASSTSSSATPRLAQPGHVGAQVAPVGRERVGRPAPLDGQPGEELLDLERQRPASDGAIGSRAQRPGRAPGERVRPMIVLASMSRPSAIMAEHVVERHALDRHVLLLDALRVVGDLGQVVARKTYERSSLNPASCRTRPAARAARPAGRPPRRARGAAVRSGGLAGDVAHAGGISSRSASRRRGTGAPARRCRRRAAAPPTTAPGGARRRARTSSPSGADERADADAR